MSSNKIITAQKRSLRNRLRESVNVTRKLTEAFSQAYEQHMNLIRALDDSIRQDAMTLKDSLSKAKKAYKELRYVDLAYWLGQFNYTLSLISAKGQKHLGKLQNDHLNEFLAHTEDAEDLDVDWGKMLKDDDYLFIGASEDEIKIIKHAGLLDIFRSDRARAARMLEKMYKDQIANRKREVGSLINYADSARARLIDVFKELDEARARGDVNKYRLSYNKLYKISEGFNKNFTTIYEKHLKQLVDYAKKKRQQEEEVKESIESISPTITEDDASIPDLDLPEVEINPEAGTASTSVEDDEYNIPDLNNPVDNTEPEPSGNISTSPSEDNPTNKKSPFVRGPDGRFVSKKTINVRDDGKEEIVDSTTGEVMGVTEPIKDITPKPPAATSTKSKKKNKKKQTSTASDDSIDVALRKIKYSKFFSELEKVAKQNDPYMMAAMLCKFSESIDDSDPDTSIELLTLAEEILNA